MDNPGFLMPTQNYLPGINDIGCFLESVSRSRSTQVMRRQFCQLPAREFLILGVFTLTVGCSTTAPPSQNFANSNYGAQPAYGSRMQTAALRPATGMQRGAPNVNTAANTAPRPYTQPSYVPPGYQPYQRQYAYRPAPPPRPPHGSQRWQPPQYTRSPGAPRNIQTASIGRQAPYARPPYAPPRVAPITTGSLGARGSTITVREGDTLYSLSRRTRVPVAEIVAANRLRTSRIEVGQKLIIPKKRYSR